MRLGADLFEIFHQLIEPTEKDEPINDRLRLRINSYYYESLLSLKEVISKLNYIRRASCKQPAPTASPSVPKSECTLTSEQASCYQKRYLESGNK